MSSVQPAVPAIEIAVVRGQVTESLLLLARPANTVPVPASPSGPVLLGSHTAALGRVIQSPARQSGTEGRDFVSRRTLYRKHFLSRGREPIEGPRRATEASRRRFSNRLKIGLRAELEDTWIRRGVNRSGSGVIGTSAGAGSAVENPVVHPRELRVVPGIEALRLELDTGPFGEVEILEQRQVPVVSSGALHDALGGIAER